MPYLHITTRIEGVPYDNLLREKGFGGFPSLAFMDAEGNVLAQPSDRSVASFSATRDALSAIEGVRTRAEAGEAAAQVELLFLENDLGKVKPDEFALRAKALMEKATPAQKARLTQIQIDNDVWDLVMMSYQGDRQAGLDGLVAVLESGKLPTPGSRQASSFWTLLADVAKERGDVAMLRNVVASLRADFADDEYMKGLATRSEETVNGLVERDVLSARVKAGEKGLEAKILLIEARLRATSLEKFRAALPAAQAVATEAELAELRLVEKDLEVEGLVDGYWGGGDRETIPVRLVELLTGEAPIPSMGPRQLAAMPILNWANSFKDADKVAELAAKMRARAEGDEAYGRLADGLEKMAKDLRAKG